MLSIVERAVRINCLICDARSYSNVVCDACEAQSRDDFYLLILTTMKDDGETYENLKSNCIDMHDAINYHLMITEPREIFDPLVDSVDFQSKDLLENYTDILNRDAVPVNVPGDGDCLFHSIQSFYPELSTNELRVRCIDELCLNEQHYSTIITRMGLELVDDESVEQHVLRILNNAEYAGVLTLAALSSVLFRPITSIYPHVNDNDGYFPILNTTFFPRVTDPTLDDDLPLRIMWSGPEQDTGRDWRPNHFVPLLTPKQQVPIAAPFDANDHSINVRSTKTGEKYNSNLEVVDSDVDEDQQEVEVEDVIEDQSSQTTFDPRQVFCSASVIIKEILDAVKNNSVDESPPHQVNYTSKFIVKSTNENRLCVGKDGNGAWIHTSSSETTFVLNTKEDYQIVYSDNKGRLHYNERVGRQYFKRTVQEEDVFILKRLYATNKANPSFRRMICHLSSKNDTNESRDLPLPMFVQYVTMSGFSAQKLRIQSHGNATKSTRPFTSTIPAVVERLRSESLTKKPSTAYKDAIHDVMQIKTPNLSTVRDRSQVYNARRKENSITDEYLTIMKRLGKENSVVARFSMSRAEAPVLVLSQKQLIQEIKRCCMNINTQSSRSVLCIDTTFNLGHFFVTPTSFRNVALQNRRTKKTPIFCGPTMVHYRNDAQSYEELLDYVRREVRPSNDLVIGSDGAPAIKNAIEAVFPDSVHLFCVRHVRENIERHLKKSQLGRDERRVLLESLFDGPESLIQSETEDEFIRRLDSLREVCHGIADRNEGNLTDSNDFFTWFNRYQLETFRDHLIASVRIQAGYLDHHGSPRLFYNNDIEALNHVLKHDANWEIQSLSRIIDIVENQMNMQKNETVRALYDAGEFEIVAPYTRFVHDPHNWSSKSAEQRATVLAAYYAYQPAQSTITTELNIPPRAGRKPGKSSIRGSTTTRKSSIKRIHHSTTSRKKN